MHFSEHSPIVCDVTIERLTHFISTLPLLFPSLDFLDTQSLPEMYHLLVKEFGEEDFTCIILKVSPSPSLGN